MSGPTDELNLNLIKRWR